VADYGLENPQMTPRLLKSLMHRRVTKIASGGVHNICVVEPNPQATVAQDVYLLNFIQARFNDVTFKGFYSTGGASSSNSHQEDANNASNHASNINDASGVHGGGSSVGAHHHHHHSSDEEMRDEYSEFDHASSSNPAHNNQPNVTGGQSQPSQSNNQGSN